MFEIDFSSSVNLGKLDSEDSTVAEAIYTIYSEYSETFTLNWNNYLIPLSKKGDLSEIYNDIVKMLILIKMNKEKGFYINFLSNAFTAKWEFTLYKTEQIRINAKWNSNSIFSNKLINEIDPNLYQVLVNKTHFVNQWDNLLRNLKQDLKAVGYTDSLDGFSYLEKL
ncbi:hypothetical protein [Xylocopilactobacillus apis]|uniref:Uncharacterized protein n=1 Tax=Xylocopilactobacillus apis TaxID=2932183 RepID=A0AAU9D4K9_9LACO|nr:hypothetical protein [Xylocopilactobacillus apis]BDR55757.1 hypothetical protein KIMC2_03190 [Xylocopilactobacillus apis]